MHPIASRDVPPLEPTCENQTAARDRLAAQLLHGPSVQDLRDYSAATFSRDLRPMHLATGNVALRVLMLPDGCSPVVVNHLLHAFPSLTMVRAAHVQPDAEYKEPLDLALGPSLALFDTDATTAAQCLNPHRVPLLISDAPTRTLAAPQQQFWHPVLDRVAQGQARWRLSSPQQLQQGLIELDAIVQRAQGMKRPLDCPVLSRADADTAARILRQVPSALESRHAAGLVDCAINCLQAPGYRILVPEQDLKSFAERAQDLHHWVVRGDDTHPRLPNEDEFAALSGLRLWERSAHDPISNLRTSVACTLAEAWRAGGSPPAVPAHLPQPPREVMDRLWPGR